MNKPTYKLLQRAAELLDATIRMIRENEDKLVSVGITECTVLYDDVECDASCLADDCEAALEQIRKALTNNPTAATDPLKAIIAAIGNVDHSKGNGANSAKIRGDLLNDIRAMALAALE